MKGPLTKLATRVTLAKIQKLSKCSSTDEWTKKMLYIQWNTIQPEKEQNNAMCSNMDTLIILSEVSQKEKDKYYMISLLCGV